MALPKLSLRKFEGGLNTNDSAVELADNEAQICLNLTVDKVGRLKSLGGQHPVIASQATTMQGLLRYANASIARLCFASGGTLTAFDEYYNSYQTLATNLSTTNNVEMASMYDRLLYVDGTGIPGEWFGDPNTGAQQAGITPPGTPCTAAASTSGVLSGTYQYYIVFGNAKGVRSMPSPISNAVMVMAQQISLTAIPVSPDSQVTLREIYRAGGTSNQIRLCGSLANNTVTTFTDNTSDTTLSLTQMQQANDVAPPGASVLLHHLNRLFLGGFGLTPYRVWFSTYGKPEYFPAIQKDLALDGSYFDVPPQFDDPIVGLSSTGSALVIGRKKSIYIALGVGEDVRQLRIRPVATIGVASHRSMVNCGNVCVFLGSDGMVYQLSDTSPQPLGLKIEKTLQNLTGVYFQYASAAYVGQRYILCIPQAPGQTPLCYAYDFRVGAWSEFSDPLNNFIEFYSDQSKTVAGELLAATGAGYKDATGTTYNGIVSTLCSTDLLTARRVTYKTRDFDMGDDARWKRIKKVRVEGTCIPADPTKPMTLTVTTDLATHTYAFTKQTGKLLETTTHADLMGQFVSFTLDGTITSGEINLLEIEYAVTR